MQTTRVFSVTPKVSDPDLLCEVGDWSDVTLIKNTSQIVVVGTDAALLPTDGSKGLSLPTEVPVTIRLPPGGQLFISADTVNQLVSVIIAPVPVAQ